MRSLILMTAAMVVFGCDATFAQQAGFARMRNAPGTMSPATSTTLPATSTTTLAPAPGTIPTPGAGPGNALGAIQLGAGTSASIVPGAMGTITRCATAGFGVTASSGIIDASSAVAISGALVTPLLPGATVPPNLSFAPSMANGTCNPAASAQNLTEFFNNTEVAPIPGLATITAELYGDATIPSAATEAGTSGLSPLIIVPTPGVATAPCVGSSAMTDTSSLAMPGTSSLIVPNTSSLAMPSDGTAAAGMSGLSSPSGC
jgi:hypothetical protein